MSLWEILIVWTYQNPSNSPGTPTILEEVAHSFTVTQWWIQGHWAPWGEGRWGATSRVSHPRSAHAEAEQVAEAHPPTLQSPLGPPSTCLSSNSPSSPAAGPSVCSQHQAAEQLLQHNSGTNLFGGRPRSPPGQQTGLPGSAPSSPHTSPNTAPWTHQQPSTSAPAPPLPSPMLRWPWHSQALAQRPCKAHGTQCQYAASSVTVPAVGLLRGAGALFWSQLQPLRLQHTWSGVDTR